MESKGGLSVNPTLLGQEEHRGLEIQEPRHVHFLFLSRRYDADGVILSGSATGQMGSCVSLGWERAGGRLWEDSGWVVRVQLRQVYPGMISFYK